MIDVILVRSQIKKIYGWRKNIVPREQSLTTPRLFALPCVSSGIICAGHSWERKFHS